MLSTAHFFFYVSSFLLFYIEHKLIAQYNRKRNLCNCNAQMMNDVCQSLMINDFFKQKNIDTLTNSHRFTPIIGKVIVDITFKTLQVTWVFLISKVLIILFHLQFRMHFIFMIRYLSIFHLILPNATNRIKKCSDDLREYKNWILNKKQKKIQ